MAEDLLAFLTDGPGFLDKWPRICQYSWQIVQNFTAKLAKNLSAFFADGPGFVSKWSRISEVFSIMSANTSNFWQKKLMARI